MRNFFKKSQNLFWGHFGPFLPKLETNFPGKKRLYQFLNIPIVNLHAKKSEKLLSHFCEKCRIDFRIMNYRRVFTFPNLQQNF